MKMKNKNPNDSITVTLKDATVVFRNPDAVEKAIAFLEIERIKTNSKPSVVVVGIHEIDEERFAARMVQLDIPDKQSRFIRLRCQGNTVIEIVVLCPDVQRGAVDTQYSKFMAAYGKFSAKEFIDIFTCTDEDYNIRYHDKIENFRRENDAAYVRKKKLVII